MGTYRNQVSAIGQKAYIFTLLPLLIFCLIGGACARTKEIESTGEAVKISEPLAISGDAPEFKKVELSAPVIVADDVPLAVLEPKKERCHFIINRGIFADNFEYVAMEDGQWKVSEHPHWLAKRGAELYQVYSVFFRFGNECFLFFEDYSFEWVAWGVVNLRTGQQMTFNRGDINFECFREQKIRRYLDRFYQNNQALIYDREHCGHYARDNAVYEICYGRLLNDYLYLNCKNSHYDRDSVEAAIDPIHDPPVYEYRAYESLLLGKEENDSKKGKSLNLILTKEEIAHIHRSIRLVPKTITDYNLTPFFNYAKEKDKIKEWPFSNGYPPVLFETVSQASLVEGVLPFVPEKFKVELDKITYAPNGCGTIDWAKQEVVSGLQRYDMGNLGTIKGFYWLDDDDEIPFATLRTYPERIDLNKVLEDQKAEEGEGPDED